MMSILMRAFQKICLIKKKIDIKIVPDSYDLIPTKQTEGAAGFDLRAKVSGGHFPLLPHMPTIINCGFKMEMPKQYHAKICSRSSMAKNGILVANSPGIIDSDYRGYVGVLLLNTNSKVYNIKYGERIAQMIIEENVECNWLFSDNINDTIRGEGGFGSTGSF